MKQYVIIFKNGDIEHLWAHRYVRVLGIDYFFGTETVTDSFWSDEIVSVTQGVAVRV